MDELMPAVAAGHVRFGSFCWRRRFVNRAVSNRGLVERKFAEPIGSQIIFRLTEWRIPLDYISNIEP